MSKPLAVAARAVRPMIVVKRRYPHSPFAVFLTEQASNPALKKLAPRDRATLCGKAWKALDQTERERLSAVAKKKPFFVVEKTIPKPEPRRTRKASLYNLFVQRHVKLNDAKLFTGRDRLKAAAKAWGVLRKKASS